MYIIYMQLASYTKLPFFRKNHTIFDLNPRPSQYLICNLTVPFFVENQSCVQKGLCAFRKEGANGVNDFRPISLIGGVYKIVLKDLVVCWTQLFLLINVHSLEVDRFLIAL